MVIRLDKVVLANGGDAMKSRRYLQAWQTVWHSAVFVTNITSPMWCQPWKTHIGTGPYGF